MGSSKAPMTLMAWVSIGLNLVFLLVLVVSVLLASVARVLSYHDPWWDATAMVFFLPIIALVVGAVSLRKGQNRVLPVYASLAASLLVVLFILTHSLFISD